MAYILPTDWELKDFYREHADALYRSCMFLTGGKADAQAMMKEILLKMLNKGIHFSSSADAKAWMILSAYKMRKKAIKAYAASQEAPVEDPPVADTQPQQAEAVADEVVADENPPAQEIVEAAQENIPAPQQLEDASCEETTGEGAKRTPEEPEDVSGYPDLLQKLSDKDRLVALLYYCEGYRKTEIGKYLGCPTFAVRFRLARIKRRLRVGSEGE